MPHVVVAGGDCARFTGGEATFDVEAVTVRRLIAELDARYPGFGAYIDKRMAISIDGEIHQDAGAVALTPTSEVYLIPRIGGG
jgi:molybdopterin converting factor small subunit